MSDTHPAPPMPGRFARGCKPPLVAPHKVKLSFRAHAIMASLATLPDSVDARELGIVPPVKDQGAGEEGTGSCEGHSCSSGTQIRMSAKGSPLPWTPSEADWYRAGREIERARQTPLGTPLPKLEDVGAQTEDMIQAGATFGIRARAIQRTRDGRDSDCEVATINDDQTFGDLEKDAERLVVIPPKHAIDPGAPDAIILCRAALAAPAMIPLRVDAFVDSAFESWTPGSAPVGAPNFGDPYGGWHAIVIVGFRKLADGTFEFLLLNSWGTGIAEAGFWWVSEAWMRAAGGITPWDVHAMGGS